MFPQIYIYSKSYIVDGSRLIRAQHGSRQIEDDDTALESYQTNEINQRNQLHLKRNQNKLPKKTIKKRRESISSFAACKHISLRLHWVHISFLLYDNWVPYHVTQIDLADLFLCVCGRGGVGGRRRSKLRELEHFDRLGP